MKKSIQNCAALSGQPVSKVLPLLTKTARQYGLRLNRASELKSIITIILQHENKENN